MGEKGDFEPAWNLYAKKVGKQAALRAWKRLPKKAREAAVAAIPAHVAATPDVTYRPHLATWLNGRRWEDEMPVSEPMTYEAMLRDAEKHGRTTNDYEAVLNGSAKPKWKIKA